MQSCLRTFAASRSTLRTATQSRSIVAMAGLTKEVITPGDGVTKPKQGSMMTMHYTVWRPLDSFSAP